MPRFATIDIGTNSVLLLVADRGADGRFAPVVERAEITRLGRGVDQSKRLAPEAIDETLRVVKAFADEARSAGAQGIAVSATSAARDASNGRDFIDGARARAGVEVEIISGDLEAQLSYAAAWADFREAAPLVVIDIGGGSTEFIYGAGERVGYRRSFDVGSVRMTERFGGDRARIEAQVASVFRELPEPPPGCSVVGIAGTVTTLFAVARAIEPYDAARVHGGRLTRAELDAVVDKLFALPLEERRRLPGLQPKRADVIPAGGVILRAALDRLGANGCIVSDRGLRWGLLFHRFGS